jgi:hypothetical protein
VLAPDVNVQRKRHAFLSAGVTLKRSHRCNAGFRHRRHVEGFVNQYVEDTIAPDGKKMVFVTEAVENIPAGWRARETYQVLNDNEFTERFELAAPGEEFKLYSESAFKRAKAEKWN